MRKIENELKPLNVILSFHFDERPMNHEIELIELQIYETSNFLKENTFLNFIRKFIFFQL